MDKKTLKEKYKDEKVFVIPHSMVEGIQDGFKKEKHNKDIYSKYDSTGNFIFRYDAEGVPALQQIIPYILIRNNEDYYISKRIDGDHRLMDKLSLGFGGHINPCDAERGRDIILAALVRELFEEVDCEVEGQAEYIGTIRDSQSATNDHFGLVFVVNVKDKESTKIREIDKLEGLWMAKKDLYDKYSNFENWSKYLIDYITNN